MTSEAVFGVRWSGQEDGAVLFPPRAFLSSSALCSEALKLNVVLTSCWDAGWPV